LLTGDTVFATVFIHTVNKKEQQHSKTLQMKTKTLLIAAAALAAGVISSQAQVYSQNIVGYVNVVIPGAAATSLIATPLDDGNANQLTNVVGGLPPGSTVTTWSGTAFNTPILNQAGVWQGNASLPPGTGYFVKNGKASSPNYTNTFVGNVVALSGGGTTTNALVAGYNLVGSQLPYGGDLTTNVSFNTPTAKGNILTSWNGTGYNSPVNYAPALGGWQGSFPISAGQGFFLFINGSSPTNWVQTLP
jgi:hypothetical protein